MYREDLNVWYSVDLVNKIITPNIRKVRSRYDKKDQLLLKDGNLVIRNMRKSDLLIRSNSTDIEYKVEAKDEYRPDLLAYKFYGDPRLAWVILDANDLRDIFELKAGMVIVVPSIINLYSSGGVMSE